MFNLEARLKSLGYSDLDDYIDRSSNETLFDEVWLWRKKAGIEEKFEGADKKKIEYILEEIIIKIIEKGGRIVDYSNGIGQKFIDENIHLPVDEFAQKIVEFSMNNPDYGYDGGGIWFE